MSHKGSVKGISSQGKRCEFSSTPLATEQVIHQELYFNDSCLLTAGQIVHNKFQIDKHFHFEFSIILPWINDALNSNVNPNWYKALHISYLNQFSASSLSPMWVLICLMVSGIHSSDNLFLKHLIKARGINLFVAVSWSGQVPNGAWEADTPLQATGIYTTFLLTCFFRIKYICLIMISTWSIFKYVFK